MKNQVSLRLLLLLFSHCLSHVFSWYHLLKLTAVYFTSSGNAASLLLVLPVFIKLAIWKVHSLKFLIVIFIFFFFSRLYHYHYECVAPLVANSLQSGRFWARSTASGSRGRSASSSSRSSAVVLVVSSNAQKARKSRSALHLHCRPFRRYAQIGLDALPG